MYDEPETTWDEAMKIARLAIYDTDGRGMIARGRNHLEERVARALIHHERRIRQQAAVSASQEKR